MPVPRNTLLPQINAGQALYGEIPIELLPAGPEMNQEDMFIALPIWDGVQWHIARLLGGGGMDISYNSIDNTVEIYKSDDRVYGSAAADAIIRGTVATVFTADAVLV